MTDLPWSDASPAASTTPPVNFSSPAFASSFTPPLERTVELSASSIPASSDVTARSLFSPVDSKLPVSVICFTASSSTESPFTAPTFKPPSESMSTTPEALMPLIASSPDSPMPCSRTLPTDSEKFTVEAVPTRSALSSVPKSPSTSKLSVCPWM